MILYPIPLNSNRSWPKLGAKDFASITYVDPPKVAKPKVLREDTEFCLHPTYGNHKYATLAKNTQKWIYVRLEKGSWPTKYSRECGLPL